MLDACAAVLKLSTTIPLGPPVVLNDDSSDPMALRACTQPEVPAPALSAVNPKKKKSVPPAPIFGLKNSVQPVHSAVVEGSSCEEETGAAFMVMPVKPNAY
jgi:hypothetical protein